MSGFISPMLKKTRTRGFAGALLALLWVLANSGPVRGEAAFTLEPAGNGDYVISGAGLANLAALDFTVIYDRTTLANPRLTKGPFVPGDASFMANTAIAGEVRLLIIRGQEMAGEGGIATLSFDRVEGRTPRILAFKSSPISVSAVSAESRDRTVLPPTSPVPTPADPTPAAVITNRIPRPGGEVPPGGQPIHSTDTGTSGGPVYLGTVTFPGDAPPAKAGTAEPARETVAAIPPVRHERSLPAERGGAAEPSRAPAEKKRVLERFPDVRERFRDYGGPPTLAGLTALFAGRDGRVTQEPPVVTADGEGTATILLALPDSGDETPVFLLEKARLVSLKADERGWLLTVLPEAGTSQARLTARTDAVLVDFPLTVVPPLPKGAIELTMDEAGLTHFLATRGTAKAPRFDLNGDGVRDYLDDYIFVGHLVVARGAK